METIIPSATAIAFAPRTARSSYSAELMGARAPHIFGNEYVIPEELGA
jgi:hypothetical protein